MCVWVYMRQIYTHSYVRYNVHMPECVYSYIVYDFSRFHCMVTRNASSSTKWGDDGLGFWGCAANDQCYDAAQKCWDRRHSMPAWMTRGQCNNIREITANSKCTLHGRGSKCWMTVQWLRCCMWGCCTTTTINSNLFWYCCVSHWRGDKLQI